MGSNANESLEFWLYPRTFDNNAAPLRLSPEDWVKVTKFSALGGYQADPGLGKSAGEVSEMARSVAVARNCGRVGEADLPLVDRFLTFARGVARRGFRLTRKPWAGGTAESDGPRRVVALIPRGQNESTRPLRADEADWQRVLAYIEAGGHTPASWTRTKSRDETRWLVRGLEAAVEAGKVGQKDSATVNRFLAFLRGPASQGFRLLTEGLCGMR